MSFKGWMFTIFKQAKIDRSRRQRGRPAEEPLWNGSGRDEPVLSLDNPLCSAPLAPEDVLPRRSGQLAVSGDPRRVATRDRDTPDRVPDHGMNDVRLARVSERSDPRARGASP